MQTSAINTEDKTNIDAEENIRKSFFRDDNFPKIIQFTNSLKLQIDWYKESEYRDVLQVIDAAVKEGGGVGSKEFSNEESIRRRIQDPNEKLSLCRDTSNKKLVSAFFFSPCSLSRSQHSPNMGSYGFVNSEYRGRGVGQNLIYLMKYIAASLGHRSVLCRQAVTSRINIPGRGAGGTYTGIIPKSMKIEKPINVVVDDVIAYYGNASPLISAERVRACL